MIKIDDRVRFIDEKKHEQFGILSVSEIKGDYAILVKYDYNLLGQPPMPVKFEEIKLVLN